VFLSILIEFFIVEMQSKRILLSQAYFMGISTGKENCNSNFKATVFGINL